MKGAIIGDVVGSGNSSNFDQPLACAKLLALR
jgi:hypothetical protein